MNKDWQEKWGGNIELWHKGMTSCGAKVTPIFNRAVLFRTFDESWHGFPDVITCPSDTGRKSIAMYWVSKPREGINHRYKAQFIARSTDPPDDRLDKLRQIRVQRRITEEDLNEIFPNWKCDPRFKVNSSDVQSTHVTHQ